MDLNYFSVDIPDVDFLVYLRVTHSRIIFLQQLGRGLRYKEGKTLTVFDYVADLRRISHVQKLRNEYEEYHLSKKAQKQIEELTLPVGFSLNFSDESSTNFLNLIRKDISELEEKEEEEEIYI